MEQLAGSATRLRPLVEEDRQRIVEMRSTDEIRSRWRGGDVDGLNADFDDGLSDDELHQLAIESIDGRVIGMIQFGEELDPDYRSASIDIFIDPAEHRRGRATDAIRTLVDYLFDKRGHHRLTIDPAADNDAAIACYTKVGFQPVGIMRSYERRSDGTWADGLLMDMLSTDRHV